MLSAFLYDPLISWRLARETLSTKSPSREVALSASVRETSKSASRARSLQIYSNIQTMANLGASDARIAKSGRSFFVSNKAVLSTKAVKTVVSDKAVHVVRRIAQKLNGSDFPNRAGNGGPLDVSDQVQRLIAEATSVESLAALFVGWCPFW